MSRQEVVQPGLPGGSEGMWVEFAAAAAMDKWITRGGLMRRALYMTPRVDFEE